MPDTFASLRPALETYLRERGLDPRKRFRCLNPDHYDHDPSMGYDPKRHKVHCFACGADYDLFDLLAMDNGYASPLEALTEASRRYGRGDVPSPAPKGGPSKNVSFSRPDTPKTASERPPMNESRANYIAACDAKAGETPYFSQRGLSAGTVSRFRLGYDPALDCVVLPCDGGRVVRRGVGEKSYLNEKGVPSPLFQAGLLSGTEPVFVVEGVFDALSAEELGYHGCAMNGSGNRTKIAAILRDLPETAPVLLLPDSDKAGDEWASALTDQFPWLYRCPPLPTGFAKLDAALDGGLYDGLYVLGAVSSLGKTTLCMQIADQLAMQGRDVLIFSLEMTAFELMARSISRESFQSDPTRIKYLSRTVRGVLDGRRYPDYSLEEREHLQKAKASYAAYAGHLWFREGDHETGLDYIAAEIRRHIRETGIRPVVLIDYLQIIAPVDVHFTDKQNLDRIVCALKKMSRQYELTVFAISSFNRENYNLEVSMNAFKESGGIDYSADVLMGLQARGAGRPGFNIDEEKRKDPRELELKILKNRSAALGAPIPFRYYPAFSCFEEA